MKLDGKKHVIRIVRVVVMVGSRVISDFLGCRVQNFPFVPSPRHNQGQASYPCLPVQMGAGSRAILRTLLLTLQSV
jgi:hypothetical protein